MTGLKNLNIANNNLPSLDLSANTKLKELYATGNLMSCIQVTDVATAMKANNNETINNGKTWEEDAEVIYSEDCSRLSNLEIETVEFYPNPTNNTISINTNKPIQSITIYNTIGAIVLQEITSSLDVSNLPNGVYLAKITLDNQQEITKRFVKQ